MALHSPWVRGHQGTLVVQKHQLDPVRGNIRFSFNGLSISKFSYLVGKRG